MIMKINCLFFSYFKFFFLILYLLYFQVCNLITYSKSCRKLFCSQSLVISVSLTMPIANIMKMRKMFYFYISMDLRVKIGCFLNNIVVIAPKTLVLSQNGV